MGGEGGGDESPFKRVTGWGGMKKNFGQGGEGVPSPPEPTDLQ